MSKIVIGQRYLSEAEPELGLGSILSIEAKSVKLIFLGSNTERNYSIKGAPLKRVIYIKGDQLTLRSGEKLTVDSVNEIEGIYHYQCLEKTITEMELSDSMSFGRPEDRLLNGQIDHPNLFNLRLKTIEHKNRISKSQVQGLIGPRLALLPHQFYVASSVTDRLLPRVLLADEVGLGKTIEAGLIIHKLIISERAKRVLILVPDSLVYQWFIEMLKKFNLHFSTLNQETYLEPNSNPFLDHELVIVNIGLLKGAEMARDMIKKVEWDLLVIDEAHQLKWSENQPSIEYKIAEMISRRSKGLLLLTATPEQLGPEGHFARLKLIDPNRFFNYQKFIEENSHYDDVARAARLLLNENIDGKNDEELKRLQDLHGTGRIFYRNTRNKMSKEYSFFPKRVLHAHALESKSTFHLSLEDEETIGPTFDLKLDWLTNFLSENKDKKILLITKSKTKVLCLEKLLQDRFPGLKLAVFHSGLSFIARDRQAQFFAESDGANLLLCTEVGSEGRNFEFAHQMILFDLPLHPDLLEQRIGRLDRIGQKEDIHIHVPYVVNCYEEILFSWYNEGLDAFTHCAKGAGIVHLGLQSLLNAFLDKPETCLNDKSILKDFIKTTSDEFHKITLSLEEGRDVLVEINSFNEKHAYEIVNEITAIDKDNTLSLFMFDVWNELGIDSEELEEDITLIFPSDNMYVPFFPCLNANGTRVTFNRKIALLRPDVEFLTWDHPMVVGVIDLILGNNLGNAGAMTRIESRENSKTFLECFFKMDVVAPRNLSPDRFVSLKSIRILIDSNGVDFSTKFSKESIDEKITQLPEEQVLKLKTLPKATVGKLIKSCHDLAQSYSIEIKKEAILQMENCLKDEVDRLKRLREINPVVRLDEIVAIEEKITTLANCYNNAEVALDSIRIIF